MALRWTSEVMAQWRDLPMTLHAVDPPDALACEVSHADACMLLAVNDAVLRVFTSRDDLKLALLACIVLSHAFSCADSAVSLQAGSWGAPLQARPRLQSHFSPPGTDPASGCTLCTDSLWLHPPLPRFSHPLECTHAD